MTANSVMQCTVAISRQRVDGAPITRNPLSGRTGAQFIPQPQAGGLAGMLKPGFRAQAAPFAWFISEQGLMIMNADIEAAQEWGR